MTTTTVPRPTREEVRDRILTAATANFETHGYADTSLRRIAADAGFTKGAVYSNFGSKPDLFCQVCTARLAGEEMDIFGAVAAILSRPMAPEALADALSQRFAEMLIKVVPWQITIAEFRALARRDTEIAAAYARLTRARVERMSTMMAAQPFLGQFGPEKLRSLAVGALGLVNVLALEHSAAPEVVDRAVITDVIRRALGGLFQ